MKFSVLATLSLASTAIAADDPSAVISSFYGPGATTIPGSLVTAVASAIVAAETSWEGSPVFTSISNAIVSAAPSSVRPSLTSSGSDWDINSLEAQPWWTGVPGSAKDEIDSEDFVIQGVVDKVLESSTTASTGGAPYMMGLMVGAMGVLGAMGVVVGL